MAPGLLAPDPRVIASAFGLGRPAKPLTPVQGGYSHRMWKLTTDRGSYAVKELNRDFADPGYLDRYEAACRVELAMFGAGIDIPPPVLEQRTGRACGELPGTDLRPTTVRVHEWVDGATLAPGPAPIGVARVIGSLLARIHALALPARGAPADVLTVAGAERWRHLSERAAAESIVWSGRLAKLLPLIAELEARVEAARGRPARLIVTHRDVSMGNVILRFSGQLVLVDWDSCGPWIPEYELASVLLRWSGALVGQPDERAAEATVRGYVDAGGTLPVSAPEVFTGCIAETLTWLDVCVRRALGERVQSVQHRRAAESEVGRILQRMPLYVDWPERWANWFR